MTEPLTKKQINYIVQLRKRGHSLPELRCLTGHGKATIFKYIQGVNILPKFQDLWRNKRKSSVARMVQEQKKAQGQAKGLINKIGKEEKILIAACLYWGEGAKRDFSLSNTDPELIKTFVECLEELGVTKERLRVTIRAYEDLNKEKICNFWAKIVGIPKKNIINVNVLKGKKKGKLKYGMCRIRIAKGGYLLKLLCALKDIIKNNNAPVVQRIEQETPKL